MLIDFKLTENIMRVTCLILQNNFFYGEESLARFLSNFHARLEADYHKIDKNADEQFKKQMNTDRIARKDFTAYFASYHLHDCLVEDCFFSDVELSLFENILPKYTGATRNGFKSSEQRKNHRKLFKGL